MFGTVTGLQGQFRQASLNASVSVKAGDTAIVTGNQVMIVRNGSVIATRTITGQIESAPMSAVAPEIIDKIQFFWRPPVAGQAVVLTKVTESQSTGAVVFFYADGTSVEYPSWAAVGTQLGNIDQQPELAQQILAYKSYVNSPDGTNKTTMIDVNCTINFAAGTPIALIEP